MVYLLALASFVGTIVGVGMFGLPYVAAQIGFLPMLGYFLVVGAIVTLLHLLYGEIVLRTPELHRLPGYCKVYFKHKIFYYLSLGSTTLGFYGSLLVYALVGSQFLSHLVALMIPAAPAISPSIFFIGYVVAGAAIIAGRPRSIGRAELGSLGVLISALIILFVYSVGKTNIAHLTTQHLESFWLPYGVVMFALTGSAAIPSIFEELTRRGKGKLHSILIAGSIIPVIIYTFFIITIVGVTGPNTTPEALVGFSQAVPTWVAALGFVIGILATFNAFVAIGNTLKGQFRRDVGLSAGVSWYAVWAPLVILFGFGVKNFLAVMGFIGGVLIGFDFLTTLLIYRRAQRHGKQLPAYQLRLTPLQLGVIGLVLAIGVASQLILA